MKLTSDKTTTFFFTLLALALISTLVVFYNNTKKVKLSTNLVVHTQDVLAKSNNILIDILNIESGLRGYVLSENESFLKDVLLLNFQTLPQDLLELLHYHKNTPWVL